MLPCAQLVLTSELGKGWVQQQDGQQQCCRTEGNRIDTSCCPQVSLLASSCGGASVLSTSTVWGERRALPCLRGPGAIRARNLSAPLRTCGAPMRRRARQLCHQRLILQLPEAHRLSAVRRRSRAAQHRHRAPVLPVPPGAARRVPPLVRAAGQRQQHRAHAAPQVRCGGHALGCPVQRPVHPCRVRRNAVCDMIICLPEMAPPDVKLNTHTFGARSSLRVWLPHTPSCPQARRGADEQLAGADHVFGAPGRAHHVWRHHGSQRGQQQQAPQRPVVRGPSCAVARRTDLAPRPWVDVAHGAPSAGWPCAGRSACTTAPGSS